MTLDIEEVTNMELKRSIAVNNIDKLHAVFGAMDVNASVIENQLNVAMTSRDSEITVVGNDLDVMLAVRVINALLRAFDKGEVIDEQKINYYIENMQVNSEEDVEQLGNNVIVITKRGKAIKPKTFGQQKYVNAIKKNDVLFGVGPAGTGKTYLAVAMAVRAFKANEVSRIIITRPAVEAGESLGFLPGDLQMKVDPYLRPLYDALYDILGSDTYLSYKERGLIEIAPLAYMRGRTLDNAFIILDEAQNTTQPQMKMFLTRLGFGSKAIINGDVTQVDLPKGKMSGLDHAVSILKDVAGIETVRFNKSDVVRHALVKRIIASYEKDEAKTKKSFNHDNRRPHKPSGKSHK